MADQAVPTFERPKRPPLAFRIGVTGARAIDASAEAAIRTALIDIFGRVRLRCEGLAAEPWAGQVHRSGVTGVEVRLRMLSPLAEGGDRLAVEQALATGYELSAVLPFAQPDYEVDFPGSVPAFRSLLAAAGDRVLVLDGGRGEDEWRSYEAVGRLVVRNCDLLVAIWDKTASPRGRGGTKDTILFALHTGTPVWWIDASGRRPPTLLRTIDDLQVRRPIDAGDCLERLIDGRLRPSPVPLPKRHGIVQTLLAAGVRLGRAAGDTSPLPPEPLAAFLTDETRATSVLWRGHERLIRALTRGLEPHATRPEPVDGYWGEVYGPADRLSTVYGLLYRSTYVYVIGLAGAALISASLASVFDAWHLRLGVIAMALAEWGTLMILLAFILAQHGGRWHERWIEYRLIAELCRKQRALALLGWSLPELGGLHGAKEADWVEWYACAVARAAPLASNSLAGADLSRTRDAVSETLLAGQITYHHHRAAASTLAARGLFKVGEGCFFATLLFVMGKLAVPLSNGATGTAVLVGLVAAVLPSVSAAIFALRAYAELEVLADQSERMVALLERLKARLDALDTTVPLASQELGRYLYHLTIAMLADVTGWAQLFSMKAVEAG